MIAKFNEIKDLIHQGMYPNAQDECDNGSNEGVELTNSLQNIKAKFIDKFGEDELFEDFNAIIETI